MSLMFTGNFNKADAGGGTIDWLNLVDQLSVVGGYTSGRYNTTGLYNLWFGYAVASDPQAVSGSHNVGLGTYAAFKNQGDYNTWVGSRAGFENLAGSENVGVGWNAGGQQTNAFGNTSLGFQGGYNALGDGNVSIGHGANSAGLTFTTDCNIAIGAAAHATGGDSMAIGADANVSGGGSLGVGVGTTVSGNTSTVVGPYVTSSGNNSLLIMPRPDGGMTTHTSDEELNIYGVVKGEREISGSYAVTIESDKVQLDNQVSRLSLNNTGMEIYSDKNITFLSPTNFTNPVTVSDTAVFSAPVVMSDGMRVSLGTSVFDGPVVFNDTVSFAAGQVAYGAATVVNTTTRNLVVENAAAFSNDVRFLGTSVMDGSLILNDAFEVLGGVDVGGDLAVTGNTVGTNLDMDSGRIGSLRVTDLDVTGSINLPAGFSFGSNDASLGGSVFGSNVVLDGLTVNSNLLVKGLMSNVGAVRADDVRAGVMRVDSSLLVRGVATYEEDLHVAESVHCKSVYTEDVHAHKLLACQVTATNGTYSNIDTVRFHCHEAEIDELTVFKYTAALSNNAVVTGELVAQTADLQHATISNLVTASVSASNLSSLAADVQSLSVSNVVVTDSILGDDACFSNLKVTGFSDLNRAEIQTLTSPEITARTVAASNVSAPTVTASNATACNVSVGDSVVWINELDTLSNHRWTAALGYSYAPSNQYADLVFESTHGTVFTLTDDFEAGVLNFTGKHRCSWYDGPSPEVAPEPGLIVITTGEFNNLDGGRAPTMDEALPVVRLSDRPDDSRAFGVVSGQESSGNRVFRLANMVFSHAYAGDPKVILNSVGEGGMWVCDANGPVGNGDLLTTSSVAGHAQRQGDDIVRSHTVAKVTGHPLVWEPYFDPVSGLECSRSFAGVVYKF